MNEKYNTFWGRFFAGLLDGLVFIPFIIIDIFLLKPERELIIVIPWLIFNYSIYFVYAIYFHWKFGQTLGKMIMKVKILDVSENEGLSFLQAFLRDSVSLIIQMYLLFRLVVLVVEIGYYDKIAVQDLTLTLGYIGLGWFIIEVITMLTNDKRRALHDFIARTVVIKIDRTMPNKS